jgi:hypothetical protein
LVFACGCAFVGCTVVGCCNVAGRTVAWLRLVRCNVVRCALPAARRLSHVVPMHQCIPFHSSCLVHVMRDCCCCSVSAARFPLPVAVLHGACCTSSAAHRLRHVVSLRASHVFGCFRMRRFAELRMIAPRRPMRLACPVGCLLQSPVAPLSVVRCTPPACTPPRARLALPPASPPLTDPLAVGVLSAALLSAA